MKFKGPWLLRTNTPTRLTIVKSKNQGEIRVFNNTYHIVVSFLGNLISLGLTDLIISEICRADVKFHYIKGSGRQGKPSVYTNQKYIMY